MLRLLARLFPAGLPWLQLQEAPRTPTQKEKETYFISLSEVAKPEQDLSSSSSRSDWWEQKTFFSRGWFRCRYGPVLQALST
ncbi:hypothetical protein Y1Q_0002717 [Alligator mississippiensis]|uniref:Uncharacterized protein n=1 Tax=Alligator mississippiensis TaxID=8496 RepID=A0A151NYW7_ALLMI|nr:hypothetical protein Y1Q_0002717 [Alligator mississippiensis]